MSLKPVSFKKPVEPKPRLSEPYVPGKRDKRYWTEAEIAAVREHFPKSGAAACLPHLQSHRSIATVYQQAHKLGLSAPRQQSGKPGKRHAITPEMEQTIRDEWVLLDGKRRGEVAELADRLGLDRWVLSKIATRLGLTMPHKKEPPWTDAETALMTKVPLHDPHRCAEIFREHGFRRSEAAIVIRAKRLNLSRRATREELSATKVARLLGVDGKTVTRWILEWGLQATKRADRRLPQQGGSSWDIRPDDLRQWIIANLEHIDLRKVEKFEFVDLLVRDRLP